MNRPRTRWSVVLLAMLAGGAWALAAYRASAPAGGGDAAREVEYRWKSGGDGPEQGIVISPRGQVRRVIDGQVVEGKAVSIWLADAELAELSGLFEGWSRLEDAYPPEAEEPIYQIRRGRKWVRAGTGAGVPEEFRRAWRKLDAIARELRR